MQQQFSYTDSLQNESLLSRGASHFSNSAQNKICWRADVCKWMKFNGKKWEIVDTHIYMDITETFSSLKKSNSSNHDYEALSYCLDHSNYTKVETLSKPLLNIPSSMWNTNDDLLNCPNGVLDLNTGELLPHNSDHYFSMVTNAEYDQSVTFEGSQFEKFLIEIQPEKEVREYLQMILGYSLVGRRRKKIQIFIGGGANGKSTLLNAIRHALGDFAKVIKIDSILKIKPGSPNPDLASTVNARFVMVTEPDRDEAINEGTIKSLTGGEPIPVRNLHENNLILVPKFDPIIATNYPPDIVCDDEATIRRLEPINFGVTIPTKDQNPNLNEELIKEASIVLKWLFDGYRKAQATEGKLDTPAFLQKNLDEFIFQNSPEFRFIEEECKIDQDASIPVSDINDAYYHFCTSTGLPFRPRALPKRLSKMSITQSRTGKTRFYNGIKLK